MVGAVSADAVDDIPIEKPAKGKQEAEEGEGGGRQGEIMYKIIYTYFMDKWHEARGTARHRADFTAAGC